MGRRVPSFLNRIPQPRFRYGRQQALPAAGNTTAYRRSAAVAPVDLDDLQSLRHWARPGGPCSQLHEPWDCDTFAFPGLSLERPEAACRPSGLRRMVGAARFELATPCSRSKCATRLRYAPPDQDATPGLDAVALEPSANSRYNRRPARLQAANLPRSKIAGDGSRGYVPCRSAAGAGCWGVAKR